MIKFHKYSKGGENMTKEDLNQIRQLFEELDNDS